MGMIIFEDEHLLVVNKPAGWNTHAPSPYAGEGVYDWLRHREPRWESLAIIHRLDKETSGVLVFSKSALANKSLTEQFTERGVCKRYLLLSDRRPPRNEFTAISKLKRHGDKYASASSGSGTERAETRFKVLADGAAPQGYVLIQAEPLTGRTHQIRVHAAEHGFPVLGDTLYGGRSAPRICLHAETISFQHPATGEQTSFSAPADFDSDPRQGLRRAIFAPGQTNAFRAIHGGSDGWPRLQVDLLGSWLLAQSELDLDEAQAALLGRLAESYCARGWYHKRLTRNVRQTIPADSSPRLLSGQPAPDRFPILENGLQYELSFQEGYSVGLFLDQRDNRRRLITGHIAAGFTLYAPGHESTRPELLNTFAYTCGFSVVAAKAGARVTSLDLSKKYLDWGRRNFELNGIAPAQHDFIFGDVFDWLKRLAKKARQFDVILLDPPTFSQSRSRGSFRAQKDYGQLVSLASPLLRPGGVLFASTNAAAWAAEDFVNAIRTSVRASGRSLEHEHYVPQPPDFPVSRAEPAYLKTVWCRVR